MKLKMDLFTMVNLYVLKHFALQADHHEDVKDDDGDVKNIYGIIFINLNMYIMCN